MDHVNWGMIGCGNVTEVKSGPAFYKANHSSLLAVMCRNKENAKSYAARHQVPFCTNDADELINHPDVNAVYVATPVKYHAPYAIQAMEAGKAVYLEKPMALNYRQCIELREVSERTGSKLFVAYYRRGLDYFIKVKELINDGAIGKVGSVEIALFKPARKEDCDVHNLHWRVIPELSGGGYFHDLACHQIDIMQYLLGSIQHAAGEARNTGGLYNAADTVSAEFSFASGITAKGNWLFVCNEKNIQDSIIIRGEKGFIEFSTFEFKPIQVSTDSNAKTYNIKPPLHIQMPFIQGIINELTGRGLSDADLESAIFTSKVMDDVTGNES
jgi:predicted dehydrogenase